MALAVAASAALLGDQMLYTVLPSQHAAAGIAAGALGVMLSVHRFIRLAANPLGGALYDRVGRRRPFLLGMTLAVVSTTGYALATGFWTLLVARLAWGIAWALISVGGLTIVLDVTTTEDRGRTVGYFHGLVGLGTIVGLLASGILTDLVGYRATLTIYAPLTAAGWLVAAIGVRETSSAGGGRATTSGTQAGPGVVRPAAGVRVVSAARVAALTALVRAVDARLLVLVLASFVSFFANQGVLMATLGAYVKDAQAGHAAVGFLAIPAASLTGMLLGGRRGVTMLAAPVAGYVSDVTGDRRLVAAAGALASLLGFAALALAPPALGIPLGVALCALGEGALGASLSAWAGDLAPERLRGVLMGWFATINDLGGATGPLVGYALGTAFGFRSAYALALALLGVALCALAVAAPPAAPRRRALAS